MRNPRGRTAGAAEEEPDMQVSKSRPDCTTRRFYPLDALLDDEAAAHRVWLDLVLLDLRRQKSGGGVTPALMELSHHAWRAWCAVGTQRAAVERAYELELGR